MPVNPTSLNLVLPPLLSPATAGATAAVQTTVESVKVQSLVAVVDIDAIHADGTLAVRVNGHEHRATGPTDFRVGGRYVADVLPGGDGKTVTLRAVSGDDVSPERVAQALLRAADRPGRFPESWDRVATALASDSPDTSPAVRRAADAAQAAFDSLRPPPDRAPTAESLRAFVRDGGLQYEAKLRALTEAGEDVSVDHPLLARDVKGALLGLLRAVGPDGDETDRAPVASTARDAVAGIEARQALNALADLVGGPFVVPLRLADGDGGAVTWATIEPDDGPAGAEDAARSYRVLLNLSYAGLGETWVDAGVGPGTVRAIVYVGDDAGRSRTASQLDDLRTTLAAEGFGHSHLDVRPVSDLPAAARRRAAAAGAGASEWVGLVDERG